MCGINGFIQSRTGDRSSYTKGVMQSLIHMMNQCIIHRGPDHEGFYADDVCALGMRRLSIIDLSGGNQPIWNEDHTIMAVFNGEIYNHKSLRSDLSSRGHVFFSSSDTEVIVHGYEQWGINVCSHLEGMFAFCIYDVNAEKWVIARDRIGEKPLYYCCGVNDAGNRYFAFASELKSLVTTGLVQKEIDPVALSIYFRLTYIPAPYTIYKDAKKLLPGKMLEIRRVRRRQIDGVEELQFKEYTYWNPSILGQSGLIQDYSKAKELLREALFDSVGRRMISDVPLGSFLSGGFDSTIITGIMSQIAKEEGRGTVNSFTIGFEDKQFDESPLAELSARKNGTDHHILQLDWDTALSDLPSILGNIDEPFADSSLIATYAVSKLAKDYVTVVLTGDAGDELFAGYNKYLGDYYSKRYNSLPLFLRKGIIERVVSTLPTSSELRRKASKVIDSASMDQVSRVLYLMSLGFSEELSSKLLVDDQKDALGFVRSQYNELLNADSQTRNQYVDLRTVLEGDMLTKVDRASMLASLETRVPMLDYHVVELAYRMPTSFKINGKDRKIVLKDTFREFIPEELFKAPKRGFGVPIGHWLKTDLVANLREYADRGFLVDQGLFNAEYINRVIDEHIQGKQNHASRLWTFFVFQNWYKKYIL